MNLVSRFLSRSVSVAVLFVGIGVAVLGAGSSATQSARAATLGTSNTTLVSGISVQNLSQSQNPVLIHFYNPDGSEVTNALISVTLPPLKQQSWYAPTQTSLPAGFVGSAVVEAQFSVAAIVNTEAPTSTGTSPSDPFRVDSITGAATGGVTAYAPQVMRSFYGYSTTFAVQNTSSTAPSHVTVTYRDRNGNAVPSATESADIPARASHQFVQANNANLGSGFLGSAVATGGVSDSIVGMVLMPNSDADSSSSQFGTYMSATAGATKVYAPWVVNNYYGFNSGLAIQNLDPVNTANVSVTFQFKGSPPVTLNASINAGASAALYLPSLTVNGQPLPAGTGGATITSNTRVAAIVNQDNRVPGQFLGRSMTYSAFLDGTQTSSAFMPQVVSRFYGMASGITVQNVGSIPGSGTITLTDQNGVTQQFSTGTIDAGSSLDYFVPNKWSEAGVNGSAVVTFSQPVFAIANTQFHGEVSNSGAGSALQFGDSYSAYSAFNQ